MGTEVPVSLTALSLVVFGLFFFFNSRWRLVLFFLLGNSVHNYYMDKFGVDL